MQQSSEFDSKDLCMSIVDIIAMVEKIQTEASTQAHKQASGCSFLEDINDIKCMLERFLRSLLMAPVHRRLYMCPPHQKYTQEELAQAWAEQSASLRDHLTLHDH
tara:strand:- start:112 stop:426 length:315 start_codon:yes stop_codon:yes gene_type:complete